MNNVMRSGLTFVACLVALAPVCGQDDPVIPQIRYVTVQPQPSGEEYAFLCWDRVEGEGYIIYHWEQKDANYVWHQIDTVFSDAVTCYLDTASLTSLQPERYRVSVLDTSITDTSVIAFGRQHSTIIASATFDPCLATFDVRWTPYTGWADSLDGYEVYLQSGTGPFVPVTASLVTDTFAVLTSIDAGVDYCLYILALHSEGLQSRSNTVCLRSVMPRPPGYINADYASTAPDGIRLRFTVDPLAETERYGLLRKEQGQQDFDTLHLFSSHTSKVIEYTDDEASSTKQWIYKLAALNSCGRVVSQSNIASNLVLTAASVELRNNLVWNTYRNWLGGVLNYQVYRSIGSTDPVLVATTSPADTSWTDDISVYQNTEIPGIFCYYVIATEAPDNPYGITGISRSNVSCIDIEPKVFIPNAIVVNSSIPQNRLFRPVFTFAPAEYHMVIYNRWNNLVFETEDYLESWDGMINGKTEATQDTFVYFIRFKSAGGKEYTMNGNITVIYR